MAVQKAVAEKWKQTTGKALIEAYGLSEASPGVAMNPLDVADYNGSIGLPIPSTEIAIRNDDGSDLGVGEVGELCVRGPQVMKGYWNNPAETAKVMMADGFMRTGDIAIVDEAGFVRIVDRKKDIIIVSGFKVYPLEVEEVMAMCPGVLEAAAFAVSDAESGHAVKAAVVRKDPALTAQDLIAHCREASDRIQGPAVRGILGRIAQVADRQGSASRARRTDRRGDELKRQGALRARSQMTAAIFGEVRERASQGLATAKRLMWLALPWGIEPQFSP